MNKSTAIRLKEVMKEHLKKVSWRQIKRAYAKLSWKNKTKLLNQMDIIK